LSLWVGMNKRETLRKRSQREEQYGKWGPTRANKQGGKGKRERADLAKKAHLLRGKTDKLPRGNYRAHESITTTEGKKGENTRFAVVGSTSKKATNETD